MPSGWMQLLESRQDVAEMLALDDQIDLIIPRGSNAFVRHIMDHTNIPVLGHADGICHVYVHGDADLDMAVRITVDSKCQYVAVCNAAETLLVDATVAERFLPADQDRPGRPRCHDPRLRPHPRPHRRRPRDGGRLGHRIPRLYPLDQESSTASTPPSSTSTITARTTPTPSSPPTAPPRQRFMNLVDSADVFWNCSTRFSDGYRFGLGAEVGISTNKIHARGPVGLEGLAIYKWKLYGKGQVVADYSGEAARKFTHKKLR